LENSDVIFVYGSNGHGVLASSIQLHAQKYYGAEPGHVRGRKNNSYAIQSRDKNGATLDLSEIKTNVDMFLHYADRFPNHIFKVAHLTGFRYDDIASLYYCAPPNVVLPIQYKATLKTDGVKRKYW
jgi:hypothetical protein